MQRAGGIVGTEFVRIHDLLIAHHLADMQSHMDYIAHVAVAQRIPWVKDIVMPKGNIVAVGQQFLDARDAAAFGIGVKASLQMRVDKRIADKIDIAHAKQTEQLAAVGIVIAVHRRCMAGCHHVFHTAFQGAAREHLKPF